MLKIDAVLSAIPTAPSVENGDHKWMRMAIEAARKSKAEDSRQHPLVGAVVVRNDQELLGSGYRGYPELGDHAEEGLVEKILRDTSVAGCTVYTTLEPCTTRGRLPCANILTEHKVGRVVVGMLDPDQRITGKGVLYLRKHGIAVDLFPTKMMAELEELNRDFIRNKEAESARLLASAEAISSGPLRSRMDLSEMALWPPAQAATDMLLIGHNLNAVFRQARFFEQKLRQGCRIRLLIADPKNDELLTVMSRGVVEHHYTKEDFKPAL
jgi:pyrimidine deaminase RibD-like protein